MAPILAQSATIDFIIFAVCFTGLVYVVAEIMQGRTPIGRFFLRAKLARIGITPRDGRLIGTVLGHEVEVEEMRSALTPFLVTATCPAPLEGLSLSPVADGLRPDRVLTGDKEFDDLVQVVGPRAMALAILGENERGLMSFAIASGWSFGQGRFSRLVQWPREVAGHARDGARLAKSLADAAEEAHRPLERIAELYRSDRTSGTRAMRLEFLLEQGGDEPHTLAHAALEAAQDHVRLVAARHLAHWPTLLDLVSKTSAEEVRQRAFRELLRATDPTAKLLALHTMEGAVHLPPTPATQIGLLVATHPFPGRLELARRWLETPAPHLRPHAYRVLGLEGDRSDLDRLVDMPADPELERARTLIRHRLVEQGHSGGQLALSSEGGELAVLAPSEVTAEDTTD